MIEITPIMASVLQERLIAIVREMRVNLMRTAFSSVIYESQDYSCALLDPAGQLVAQAEDNPSHIFPLPFSTRKVLELFGPNIRPGDVFVVNDPYIGGTHLNDVAVVTPLFLDGRLRAIPAVRAHWGDVGGMVPGSLSGKATTIYQEGIRIPPLRIVDEGRPNEALIELLFANMRSPDDRRGDFNAMLSTCYVAQRRLEELFAKLGADTVDAGIRRILDDSEAQMRAGISTLRKGVFHYENYLDSSGTANQPLPVRLKLTVSGDVIEADFTGSAPQVAGPINGGIAVAPTGVFVILKSFINPGTAVNEGTFRPIKVYTPPGTVLNARHPAACGGFSEIRRNVEAAVLGCLSQAIPDLVAGDTKGAANHCTISSFDAKTQRSYLFYEYPAGGTGGWKGADGNNATRIFSEGDFSSIQPVESIEVEHPLIVERTELRQDSCGDGFRRGGLGLRREIRVLSSNASLSVLSDRNVIPPFGVCGGYAGAPNRFVVRRGHGVIAPSDTPGKCSEFPLMAGDIVIMETAGGGGYGNPLEREIEAVARDVDYGYITRERAESRYGVVFDDKGPDRRSTVVKRAEMLATVKSVAVAAAREDTLSDGLRVFRLDQATSAELGLAHGDLIELSSGVGASLRGWVLPEPGAPAGSVRLGPVGLSILGCKAGDRVAVRVLHRGPPVPTFSETAGQPQSCLAEA